MHARRAHALQQPERAEGPRRDSSLGQGLRRVSKTPAAGMLNGGGKCSQRTRVI